MEEGDGAGCCWQGRALSTVSSGRGQWGPWEFLERARLGWRKVASGPFGKAGDQE